jgi:hypothetical protein
MQRNENTSLAKNAAGKCIGVLVVRCILVSVVSHTAPVNVHDAEGLTFCGERV